MSNFSPVDWSRAIVNKQYRPLNTVFNFQNRKSMNPACLIYIKLLIQIFLLSLCKGVPQWRYWLLKLLFILNLQMNISTFYAHHVTPHTLKFNELFHSALPWEYDVYVHSMRRSNCIVMNQHKHNTLTDVDTISVSSARRYNVFIQCVLSNTFTQAIHPHVSLELLDTTQPLAQYLLFFTNTNTTYMFIQRDVQTAL